MELVTKCVAVDLDHRSGTARLICACRAATSLYWTENLYIKRAHNSLPFQVTIARKTDELLTCVAAFFRKLSMVSMLVCFAC